MALNFVNRHVAPNEADIKNMLAKLGLASLDELVEQTIPRDILLKEKLKLSEPLSENEYLLRLKKLAQKNKPFRSLIGGGYFGCGILPVVVRNIFENPCWYTSYTPYQAEISQGRLEALLIFQTMISSLNLQQWLRANGRRKVMESDKWYIDFASTLMPAVTGSSLFKGQKPEAQEQAVWALTLYFQDSIGQNGGWTDFTRHYRTLYPGRTLPFLPTGENYAADEINPEDVALVLWTQLARPARKQPGDYTLFNPEDERLAALAGVAYDLMDTSFEQAPVNDEAPSIPWVKGTDSLLTPAAPLPDSAMRPDMNPNALRCLAHTGGYPLLYFADYDELRRFFVDTLGWPDRPGALLPDLAPCREFVIYANTKGILLAHDVAACFRDPHNPMYDPQRAIEEGHTLFCQPGRCPFDLLKAGMALGLLPDARFPFHNGRALLHDNWDFVARYYLGEYYEGR